MRTLFRIIICLFFPVPAMVFAASPMVEKHIFLPEKPKETKESVSDDTLKKALQFTGVLISDKGKYAFIKKKAKKSKDDDRKGIYSEGEEISGALLTRIEPNYVLLTNNGNEIKLKLFDGNKKRPAPVRVKQQKTNPAKSGSAKAKSTGGKKGKGKANKNSSKKVSREIKNTLDHKIREKARKEGDVDTLKAQNPFANALKKAMQNNQNTSTTNPFLEAIKRAQQKKQQQ